MNSSEEVRDALGEAEVTSVQVLAEKKQALEEACGRYALAKELRDEQAMSDESRLIDALRELIPELERDARIVLEARGKKEATARLTGIKSAYGGTVTTYQGEEAKVEQAVAALKEAITALTLRARKLEALQAEANALTDRFDLPAVKLEVLPELPSIELPALWRHHIIRPSFEETTDSTRRTRRDYAEIRASAGYGIIMRAGLRSFRSLTPAEQEALEDRAEERKPDPVLAAAAAEIAAFPSSVPATQGIHRG